MSLFNVCNVEGESRGKIRDGGVGRNRLQCDMKPPGLKCVES